jgi:hypothetical protein
MPAPPTLQRFVADQLVLAPALVGKVVAGSLQLLGQARESGYGAGERVSPAEVAQSLARNRERFESPSSSRSGRRVQETLDGLAAPLPRDAAPRCSVSATWP